MIIRPLTQTDWPEVERIYSEGIATGNATFESTPPSWDRFDAGKLHVGRLVAVDVGGLAGWAAVSPVSSREVYQGVVEHSVYVADRARGRGLEGLLQVELRCVAALVIVCAAMVNHLVIEACQKIKLVAYLLGCDTRDLGVQRVNPSCLRSG